MLPDTLRAVCFDIGGVLVSMPRGALADELAALLDRDVEHVRTLLIEHGKRRRTDPETLARVLAERCDSPRVDEVAAVLRRRLDDIGAPRLFPDTLPTLRLLRDTGWRICFLTNTVGAGDSRFAPGYYSFAETVTHSWEIGHCKPDIEAFRAVEHRMGLAPHQLVKVGDSPRFDITGAHRAGWATVHLDRDTAPPTLRPDTAADHTIRSLRELPGLLPARATADPARPGGERP